MMALFFCIRSYWPWGYKNARAPLPPGPWGIPLVGHLAILRTGFYGGECIELARKYGPVFRLKLGVQSIVLVNDFDLIKEILSKKECLYRPQSWVFKASGGVGSLNAEAWRENRRYCVKALRELSTGRKSTMNHIREEIRCLRDEVAEAKGGPMTIRSLVTSCVVNVIAEMVLGGRYEFNDPKLTELEQHLDTFVKLISGVIPVNPLPKCLTWISEYIPVLGGNKGLEFTRDLTNFFSREVALRLETGKSDANRHFIDGYLTLITQHLGQPDLNINIDTLHGNLLDFFAAGTSTSAAIILCIIYHCANQPDTLQAKIYGEIDRVVGSCNTPTWEDHHAMPYTMAVIWEMQRWKTLTPINLPRLAEEDVSLNGYRIPKGTVVLANFWAVHFNPKYWKNPEEFDPSRFLTHDESALLSKPEYLLTFSIGRRMCPGEVVATVQVFLCVTTLLQKFRVLPEQSTSFSVATDHYTDLLTKRLCFLSRHAE